MNKRVDLTHASARGVGWRRIAVVCGCALLFAGCIPNEERKEPLVTYEWHGHDDLTPPVPAASSARVSVAEVPKPVLLNAVSRDTLDVWEKYMADDAVANYTRKISSVSDAKRRDEICAEFLVMAIEEHLATCPNEKIDYKLFLKGVDSQLDAPPPFRAISREERYKLDENDKYRELKSYYEHYDLYGKRDEMMRNIRRVFSDNRLNVADAIYRFPLVMMLHYEFIGRGIVLEQETKKLREGL